MSRRIISQRVARELSKRVVALEGERNQQRSGWSGDYPGGTNIGSLKRERDWLAGRIEAARMLGHAIVVTHRGDGELLFYALPLPK